MEIPFQMMECSDDAKFEKKKIKNISIKNVSKSGLIKMVISCALLLTLVILSINLAIKNRRLNNIKKEYNLLNEQNLQIVEEKLGIIEELTELKANSDNLNKNIKSSEDQIKKLEAEKSLLILEHDHQHEEINDNPFWNEEEDEGGITPYDR